MENYQFDLIRIFIGDTPWLFLFEILLRTTVLYIYALLLLRLFSQRSSAQLTPVDVLVIVALGSSVGDPMFYADVPLLHGMVVITTIMALRKLGLAWGKRQETVEDFIRGVPVRLVEDGRIDLRGLEKAQILREELFGLVRKNGYRNLGQIERLYLESDGQVSIFPNEPDAEQPGLPVEPPWEISMPSTLAAEESPAHKMVVACVNCANTLLAPAGAALGVRARCGGGTWVLAE